MRLNGELTVAPSRRQPHPRRAPADRRRGAGHARGTSPPPWPPARSPRRSPPAAPCVLKPATETPLTAYVLAGLFAEAGVPAGVVNVLTTSPLRRHRQRHAARPARAQALVHRLDRGRPHAAQGGRRPGAQLLDGARRQRALRGLRRRRPRRRARRRDDRQDAQRRRGLHRRQPLLVQEGILAAFTERPRRAHVRAHRRPRLRPGDPAAAR